MSEDLPKGPSRWILIGAVLFVIALWVGTVWLVPWFDRLGERGTFGDMFGAVNALFTGLAFAFVVYGLAVQRHEVKLLSEELQGTKRLAEEQQKLAEVQISAQQKQQFEVTFFNLLRVFNDLVTSMDLRRRNDKNAVVATGRDVFPIILDDFRDKAQIRLRGMYPSQEQDALNLIEAYEATYQQYRSDLGHYFRTLYNLFRYIDEASVENKRTYSNLIRAQISDDEAVVIFLNGLSSLGKEHFKPYLEKYSVLKSVDRNTELVRIAIEDAEKLGVRYDESAFTRAASEE